MRITRALPRATALASAIVVLMQPTQAQDPADSVAVELDWLRFHDAAWTSARDPYRGLQPFAAALFSPFREREWFVLSFFHYWTGFVTTGTAEEHWVVRQVSGDVLGDPATMTTWAWSDDCPALERAIAGFRPPSWPAFTDGAEPVYDPERIIVSSGDYSVVSLWARLGHENGTVEIKYRDRANADGPARWVVQTRDVLADCFVEEPPDLPDIEPFTEQLRWLLPRDLFDPLADR